MAKASKPKKKLPKPGGKSVAKVKSASASKPKAGKPAPKLASKPSVKDLAKEPAKKLAKKLAKLPGKSGKTAASGASSKASPARSVGPKSPLKKSVKKEVSAGKSVVPPAKKHGKAAKALDPKAAKAAAKSAAKAAKLAAKAEKAAAKQAAREAKAAAKLAAREAKKAAKQAAREAKAASRALDASGQPIKGKRGPKPKIPQTPVEIALASKPGAVVARIDAVKLAAFNKAAKEKKAEAKRDEKPVPPPNPVIAAPTPAPPTAEKALKNKAGFGARDLEAFRDLLISKRRDLVGDMNSMEREALRESSSDLSSLPVHMADQGTDAYEQEFTLNLVEKDRVLLREINVALLKIQNGTYGICEGTGQPISPARLEAQPWARHSIEHARAMEKKQMMFRR